MLGYLYEVAVSSGVSVPYVHDDCGVAIARLFVIMSISREH